jgi:hypothetical protein
VYKQIGNAVPCNLAYNIGISIIHCMVKIHQKKYSLEILGEYLKKIEKNSHKNNPDNKSSQNMSKEAIVKKHVYKFIEKKIVPIIKKTPKLGKPDVVKKHMDMLCYNMTENEWCKNEERRIKDKQINNKIGELHEHIISESKYWKKCKNSNNTHIKLCGVDVYKEDESVFIEIKNKYNTLNSSSKKETINKLTKIKQTYPEALCVIGIINGTDHIKQIKNTDVFEYSGKELYKLVYGNDNYYNDIINILEMTCINNGLCEIKKL